MSNQGLLLEVHLLNFNNLYEFQVIETCTEESSKSRLGEVDRRRITATTIMANARPPKHAPAMIAILPRDGELRELLLAGIDEGAVCEGVACADGVGGAVADGDAISWHIWPTHLLPSEQVPHEFPALSVPHCQSGLQ